MAITHNAPRDVRMGLDIGSTTAKLVILDASDGNTEEGSAPVLFSRYRRHHADLAGTAAGLLEEAATELGDMRGRMAVCGSGGKPVADALGVNYVQEVVANTAAVRALYPQAHTAIELGGQDAKVVFFRPDDATGRLVATDMRMNGSCAGGTGAFIDEMAKLFDVPTENFEGLAAQGTNVYEISGRCGVFAKTDIQPLLIQGASREDLALSTFHAIAKQTIGGLAQGLELEPPIVFEGGPLTYNPTLVRVFAERLGLDEARGDVIRPEHPETIVARGAALACDELFPLSADAPDDRLTLTEAARRLRKLTAEHENENQPTAPAPGDDRRHVVRPPLFASDAERQAFTARHDAELGQIHPITEPGTYRVWLGIDSGSTTSKFVLLDDDENVVDTFYAHNQGDPVRVVRDGLLAMKHHYEEQGIQLDVRGLGTTGYGEQLFARAFQADYHTVETVAHALACRSAVPDVTFVLDIGGQDMKAIWLRDGVVTDIMLNEACSSGCGSFLENFADNLQIPVENIAQAAFSSTKPANLGSRCTVFMTSTIINEQRNGHSGPDIMAGLCRSIIENVFTKVVRVPNTSYLGNRIVAQGGTFRNRAVLRALEEYLGCDVTLAPFPGEMGAIGAALAAKHHIEANGYANGLSALDGESSFVGLNTLEDFSYTKRDGVRCTGCSNACSRTVVTFSTGAQWVTGNRCERGAVVEPEHLQVASAVPARTHIQAPSAAVSVQTPAEAPTPAPDLFRERARMLFETYESEPVRSERDEVIGLPRVLEYWDSMPFWSTFLHALGYRTKFSHPSSRRLFESGLRYVASDTICLPAKLVHGHIADLAQQGVDRILLPHVMHMPPEGTDKLSPYVCSILMGYPMVVRNFESPEKRWGVRYDTPVFHWFSAEDRVKQIEQFAIKTLGATREEARAAFEQGEAAELAFRNTLASKAQAIIEGCRQRGTFAMVLAGRPYHTDPFVSHDVSRKFSAQGIPVVPVDSLPGLDSVQLKHARVEITNDFHTRMLAGAVIAAADPALEYTQIVSFGCGHDAILSDEIVRICREVGGKSPLILKMDETSAAGSLGIRIQSFVETVQLRRAHERKGAAHSVQSAAADATKAIDTTRVDVLPDAYPTKFLPADKSRRTLIIPNISREVMCVMKGVFGKEGFNVQTVPVGGIEQVHLGKRYTHNDICFPCQMVIGELIDALQRGNWQNRQDEVAVGMVKFQCDCRMSHYAALLRRALDNAGFNHVPILTTDVNDTKDAHPGTMLFSIPSVVRAVWCFMMLDILTDLRRKIRPYELVPGQTNIVYERCVQRIADGAGKGLSAAISAFKDSIEEFKHIGYDRSVLRPRVLVTGELLVTYHTGSNFDVENYLEANGMECIFPRVTDQLRKDFIASASERHDFHCKVSPEAAPVGKVFDLAQATMERIAASHPLYEHATPPRELYEGVSAWMPKTLSCGEGWLMASEIVHYAQQGVRSFIILQPFGCLPNHVCGRGVTKRIKDDFPGIQILPLDLDPDTSFANVENRLQMLIMNERDRHATERKSA